MAVVFETKGLTVGYSGLPLFKDMHLQLNSGELICFMGPNGCGKSTLIRTFAGLQQPLSGTVPAKNEKQIAVVLTDRIQSQHMTVSELITFGRYPYLGWDLKLSDSDKAMIETSIDLVRVRHLIDKKINELSDGQMQMVMIARALAQDTPVVLLDEPTAHLDLNNRLEVMNLLRQLARTKGKSILLATHELDLALQTADGVWLATGATIRKGVPEDLVLDGSFDSVFQFKGYDLKTGKVQHEAWRKISFKIVGEDAMYLWTKNAMERNGFIIDESATNIITIKNNGWNFEGGNFNKLEQLVDFIISRNSGV
jgi:iron complex transport system ATP-binding protein